MQAIVQLTVNQSRNRQPHEGYMDKSPEHLVEIILLAMVGVTVILAVILLGTSSV